MTRIVQEKFQIRPKDPKTDCESCGWVDDKNARAKKNMPGREGRAGGDYRSRLSDKSAQFNGLPPGMDIEDQEVTDQREFRTTMQGESDVSADYPTPEQVKKGFIPRGMLTTDDEYTNEHTDTFYGEVEVDGVVGFAERGNLLDRL